MSGILEAYQIKQKRNHEAIIKALAAVTTNLKTQLQHKEEQAETEHLVGKTGTQIEQMFNLHKSLFPSCFAVVTSMPQEEKEDFTSKLERLLSKFDLL